MWIFRLVGYEEMSLDDHQGKPILRCSLEKYYDLRNTVKIAVFCFPRLLMTGSELCVYNFTTHTLIEGSSKDFKRICQFG